MSKYVFGLLLILLVVVGCGGSQSVAPINTPVTTHSIFKLKPGTKVLSESATTKIVSISPTSIIMSGAIPQLKVGDIVACKFAGGGVRTVTSLDTNGGQTSIGTASAGLMDAFSKVDVTLQPFGQKQLGPIRTSDPGVSAKWKTNLNSSTKTGDLGGSGGIGDTLELTLNKFSFAGNITLSGTIDVKLNTVLRFISDSGFLDVGTSPSFKGSITAGFTGQATYHLLKHNFIDQELETFPIDPEFPFIFATPHIIVGCAVDGYVNEELDLSLPMEYQYNNIVHHRAGVGWTYDRKLIRSSLKPVATCKTDLGVDLTPIFVEY